MASRADQTVDDRGRFVSEVAAEQVEASHEVAALLVGVEDVANALGMLHALRQALGLAACAFHRGDRVVLVVIALECIWKNWQRKINLAI